MRGTQPPTSAGPKTRAKFSSRASRRGARVITTFVRFGSGLPRLSKVFRPITTKCPSVSRLNHLKSSGRCHGILFSHPITRLSDIAAMAFTSVRPFLVVWTA